MIVITQLPIIYFIDSSSEKVTKYVYFIINEIEVPIEEVLSSQCSADGCNISKGENSLSAQVSVASNLPPVSITILKQE